MVGVSKSVVKAAIRRLTNLGVLTVNSRMKGAQHLPNAYTFPDPPPSFFTAGQSVADEPRVGRLTDQGRAADNATPGAADNPRVGRPAVPEVDREEVDQEQAYISGSAGAASGVVDPLRGSQGLAEVGSTAAPRDTAGSTAGPGSTDGPPLATDGPGSTPGSLAGTAGSAGPTAGSGDGQRQWFWGQLNLKRIGAAE